MRVRLSLGTREAWFQYSLILLALALILGAIFLYFGPDGIDRIVSAVREGIENQRRFLR